MMIDFEKILVYITHILCAVGVICAFFGYTYYSYLCLMIDSIFALQIAEVNQ